MTILTDHEVAERLDLAALSSALEEAFKTQRDSYTVPTRMVLEQGEHTFLLMPCYGKLWLGVKVVIMSREPGRGARVVKANYTLYNARSGDAVLALEATSLTDLRTAATSAVATQALARADSSVLGIFGTGRQARAHLPAMLGTRQFKKVLVCGSDLQRSRDFANHAAKKFNVPVHAADARTCAAESHVLCTCTTSTVPLFDGRWLQAGTHLNLVGAFRPDNREVDDETVRRSRVVVDTYEGCLAEAGDLLIPQNKGAVGPEHIIADLHELLAGKKQVRRGSDDITLFKSVGCAIEDLVAARLLCDFPG